mgnify:CR=1 FL=1
MASRQCLLALPSSQLSELLAHVRRRRCKQRSNASNPRISPAGIRRIPRAIPRVRCASRRWTTRGYLSGRSRRLTRRRSAFPPLSDAALHATQCDVSPATRVGYTPDATRHAVWTHRRNARCILRTAHAAHALLATGLLYRLKHREEYLNNLHHNINFHQRFTRYARRTF